ncbi:MAG: VIT1/CCC1 transporter family protein [Nanoarchaeota archaeon]
MITTLGLIVGLHATTNSALFVIGGILVIAIADAMSDALGIHISEEFENHHSTKQIWEATIATFLTKFIFSLTFIIPVLLLPLSTAIIVSIIYGLILITIFSYYMAKEQKVNTCKIIFEHLIIAIIVIIATHYIGDLVASFI